jgi:hypothetical protein
MPSTWVSVLLDWYSITLPLARVIFPPTTSWLKILAPPVDLLMSVLVPSIFLALI